VIERRTAGGIDPPHRRRGLSAGEYDGGDDPGWSHGGSPGRLVVTGERL